MPPFIPFNRSKFLHGDKRWQHKKCAELIKQLYESFLNKNKDDPLLDHYHQLTRWINIAPLKDPSFESLSNRYHWHLQEAHLSLKEHNLLPSIRIDDRQAKESYLPHHIYLDDVRSAYNVGSILRTAEALRIGQIAFSPNTPFIENEKVKKTAMGAEKHISCTIVEEFIKGLPRPFIGMDTSDDAIGLYDFLFPENQPFTLFLGNEEFGLSKKVLKEIDYLVEIPMLGIKNSLNVACAFAICASEIRRQTKKVSSFA